MRLDDGRAAAGAVLMYNRRTAGSEPQLNFRQPFYECSGQNNLTVFG